MYPQIPREMIADPLGSMEHILRTNVLTLLASKNYTGSVLAKGDTTIPCILLSPKYSVNSTHNSLWRCDLLHCLSEKGTSSLIIK